MAVREKRKLKEIRRSSGQYSDSDDDDTFLPSGHTNILSSLPRPVLTAGFHKPPRARIASEPCHASTATHVAYTEPQLPTAPAVAPEQELPKYESIQPLRDVGSVQASLARARERVSRSVGDRALSERSSCSSIVDGLLFEIYDRWHFARRDSFDSDTTYYSSTASDAFLGRGDSLHLAFAEKSSDTLTKSYLKGKDISELYELRAELKHRVAQHSARLIRQLKNRDRRLAKVNRHCDIITAILQASSPKRRIDSKIKFSIEPLSGEDTFNQWRDAMKAVARLPSGIPAEFRKKVWLALADNHISNLKVDWAQTRKLAFNERSNPDDNTLGLQIVKDLHRTGCSGFSGTDNDEERAVLKRVLLAYARWNKKVGYCQGFNVLAALILDVMNKKEDDALKVMIYLVDHVLPESYFANNLRALSVDMAVFRDLLHVQLPQLSKHLDHLQAAARDDSTGANYEPPLTNVFTMQWFLTMFATCLPKATALRVWDSVLLEGSEILLRTAVGIWGKLQNRIMGVQTADEFYTTMGTLTHEMLGSKIVDADNLIKFVYAMAPVPFPQLAELREKYTYNITPFTAAMSTGQKPSHKPGINIFSDEDDFDDDDFAENINCFTGMFPPQVSPSRRLGEMDSSQSASSFDISKISPGAYGTQPEVIGPLASGDAERMSLDIDQLKKQYKRLRQRQNQAHIILSAASAKHNASKPGPPTKVLQKTKQVAVAPIHSPVAVNHLFIGRQLLENGSKRNKAVTSAPHIAPYYPNSNLISTQIRPKSQGDEQEGHQFRVSKGGALVPDTEGTNKGLRRSTSRSISNDSSGSGTSTLQSSERSDSASDMSAFGIDSDVGLSDVECLTAQDLMVPLEVPDLIDFGIERSEMQVTESDAVEQGSCVTPCSIETESTESSSVCGNTEDEQEFSVNVHEKDELEPSTPSGTESVDQTTDPVVKDCVTTSVEQTCTSNGSEIGSHSAQGHGMKDTITPDSSLVSKQAKDQSHSNSNKRGKITDPETHYVASLTYKAQKALQSNSKPSSKTASSHAQNHASKHVHQGSIPVCKSASAAKVFNPFPGQHMNSRRMQNGVKLGLYSASNVPKLETGIIKTSGVKTIGRAQINACLHRQYMEEIRQKSRSNSKS